MNQLSSPSATRLARSLSTSAGVSSAGLQYGQDVWSRQVQFDRPKVLNSLNLDMIRDLTPKLQSYENNPYVAAITFKGLGGKAFCAGGDIRFLYDHGQKDGERQLALDFFREEYRLNYYLATMKTPVLSFLNGITMGGGVGLSIHGKFVIATEKTKFAMPETGIGFFPDVGGSIFLPRLGRRIEEGEAFVHNAQGPRVLNGQGLGTYLALTGARLGGEEAYGLGVATHKIEIDDIPRLEHNLTGLSITEGMTQKDKDDMINELIEEFVEDEPEVNPEFTEGVERIFGAKNDDDTVEGIMNRLRERDDDWSKETLQTMEKMSPLSLKVTLKQMREGAKKNKKECFEMEYRMASRMMTNADFFEGVRAVIVDKDNKPKWKHASVEEVTDSEVDAFFESLDEDEELILFGADEEAEKKE